MRRRRMMPFRESGLEDADQRLVEACGLQVDGYEGQWPGVLIVRKYGW